jgi:hypothetical protein
VAPSGRRPLQLAGSLFLLALIWWALPTSAAATGLTAAYKPSEVVEAGFKMQGSHGYTISVVAFSGLGSHKGRIELTASRRGATASYSAPAIVTPDTLRADLGSLGGIDVVRRPSGREKKVHPKCLGGAQTYEAGTYEGIIEFNGEQGFTRAREKRVAQLPAWLVFTASVVHCGGGYGEAVGAGERGARLHGLSFAHGRSLSFQVNKNGPRSPAVFTASLKERRDGIVIDRELTGDAPPSAFRFEPNLRTATLSPAAPFSGSASLGRSRNSFSPIWTGDLKLDFPGRSAVPLVGPGVHVSLVHARFTRSNGPHAEIGF